MNGSKRATVLCLFTVLACGSPDATANRSLFIELSTDLVPGAEIFGAEVVLFPSLDALQEADGGIADRAYLLGTDTLPKRIAAFETLQPGTWAARVRLLDASGSTRLERAVLVEVAGNTTATVIMTRDCEGVSCPGAGDTQNALACLGGRCVDPRCTPQTPEYCPEPDCTIAAECPPVATCAERRCNFGLCMPGILPLSCTLGRSCNPLEGCTLTTADHCRDGVANQGETGVDCGGPCTPCLQPVAPQPAGWELVAPTPQAITPTGIWSAGDTVWLTGEGGEVLRRVDDVWMRDSLTVPTTGTKASVKVFGSDPETVWIYGASNAVHRWDGKAWSTLLVAEDVPISLWASGEEDVWIVTRNSVVLHWNGERFEDRSPGGSDIVRVFGSGPGAVWLEGASFIQDEFREESRLLRWNGSGWTPELGAPAGPCLSFAADDLWCFDGAGAHHFDGSRWTEDERLPDGNVTHLWGSASGHIWLLQEAASTSAWHWNGTTWMAYSVPLGTTRLVGVSNDEVIVAGPGQVFRGNGLAWRQEVGLPTEDVVNPKIDAFFPGTGRAIWGVDDDQVWMTAGSDILYWNGSEWRSEFRGAGPAFYGLHGTTAENLWAVGASGQIAHRSNTGWTVLPSPVSENLTDVWAASANAVFAVGRSGTVLFYDGSSWREHDLGTRDLYAVWAASATSAVAGGRGGVIYRWDGSTWLEESISGAPDVHDIAASSPRDIWVVTRNSATSRGFHWDGVAWTDWRQALPGGQSVWLAASDNVHIADNNSVWHWNGTQWDREILQVEQFSVHKLWTSPRGSVWLSGENVLLRR